MKNINHLFDKLESEYQTKDCSAARGYMINGNNYDSYMANSEWESFLATMENSYPEVFKQFGGKKGKEIHSGSLPPHMASYGSSSQMIYLLARDIPGFNFEYILPTKVGRPANLDGMIELNNHLTLIEAKKHEIYSSHSIAANVLKAYKAVYEHLEKDGLLTVEKNHFKIDGKVVEYFDLKQLICHFLAIANGVLSRKLYSKNIRFLYLIFNPKSLDNKQINDRYEETIKECGSKDFFEKLYSSIVDFQVLNQAYDIKITDEYLNHVKQSFTFKFVDQDSLLSSL